MRPEGSPTNNIVGGLGILASLLCTPFLAYVLVILVSSANLAEVLIGILVWPAFILGFSGGLLALDGRSQRRVYGGFTALIFFGTVMVWLSPLIGLLILAMSILGLILAGLSATPK